jgi:hypothetical protein
MPYEATPGHLRDFSDSFMAKFAHNLHERGNARYKEGTARGFLSPSVKPRTGQSGGTLAKMPSSIKVTFPEFHFHALG